jgi:hypothetical protein
MALKPASELSADQVLVTVGTVPGPSSLGGVETERALITDHADLFGFAARDAGLVDVDPHHARPVFRVRRGPGVGLTASSEYIAER